MSVKKNDVRKNAHGYIGYFGRCPECGYESEDLLTGEFCPRCGALL